MQRPGGGHGGVELAHRPRRGIARIGEGFLAVRGLAVVQGGEILLGHVDLAAHLEDLRRVVGQALGDVRDRAGVRGDGLALGPVAAGRGLDQPTVHVTQRQREPVDLGLGGIGHGLVRREREEPADAGIEFRDLLGLEGVAEREHRDAMAHLGEALGRWGADAPGWALDLGEVGKAASSAASRRLSAS